MSGKRQPAQSKLPLEPIVPREGDKAAVIEGASTKAQRQEFFLPVTGFVWFYPEEMAVIDHPAFQRLGRVNQLGHAYLAFRGGTHKRAEHVLGTVHIVQKMISSVNFNIEKSTAKRRPGVCAPLNDYEQRFIRLGALLHDIGHVAAGHTLEDELELVGKHDADERLDLIFEKSDWDSAGALRTEPLQDLINRHYTKYIPPQLTSDGVTATEIARLLIRKAPEREEADKYATAQGHINRSAEIRYHVCANMIGNTICADLLDYLYRDWYHVGKPRTADDRIFQYMEIRRSFSSGSMWSTPAPSPDDRFVIALGQKTKVRTDGVSAILGLLEWRYDLAEMVLFHRIKSAASAMLDRALYELWSGKTEKDLVGKILPLSDDQLLDDAIKEADRSLELEAARDNLGVRAAAALLRKLRDRALFKELATFDATNLAQARIGDIKRTYAKGRSDLAELNAAAARNRAETARLLESDFDLPPGSIAIYCSHIKPKIAGVSVAIDADVMNFSDYEKEHANRLSGGHLEAQIVRFARLWRIYFFIDGAVKSNLSSARIHLLQQMIEEVVLAEKDEMLLISRVKEKALHYELQGREAGNRDIEFRDELLTAARSDSEVATLRRYPNGAPSLRSFLRRKGIT